MDLRDVAAFAAAAEKLRALPALARRPELAPFLELAASFGARPPSPRQAGPLQIDLVDLSDGEAAAVRVDSDPEPDPGPEGEAEGGAWDPGRLPEEREPPPPLAPAEGGEGAEEACARARAAAQEALARGEAGAALALLTEAVLTGAGGALLYARRGELLLAQRRPLAALRDCSAALELNPDCGKALRVRGAAHRALGRWAAAHRDLAEGQRLDYDEAAARLQRLVARRLRPGGAAARGRR